MLCHEEVREYMLILFLLVLILVFFDLLVFVFKLLLQLQYFVLQERQVDLLLSARTLR